MTKEQVDILLAKLNKVSDMSWEQTQIATGMEDVHKDTFRKGCFMLKLLMDDGVIDIQQDTGATKKISKGNFISELMMKYSSNEHFTQEDLLKLHNLKLGDFKIKSAKSTVWGSEGNENIYSSITYEPENGVSFEQIANMYTDLCPKKLKPYNPKKRDGKVVEMIPADLHFNKIAYDRDGEVIWDTDIAAKVMMGYVEHMSAKAIDNGADKCIFVWSNDFFNSESTGSTTHGTPQRNDKPPEKAFELGAELLISAIEYLRQYFSEVDVIYVPSNHDKSQSFNLACLLSRYFEKDPNVTFDNSPTAYRKYRKFGINTNGYTHDIVNSDRIRGAMQEEAMSLMAGSKERIFHGGHKHTLELKEHNGSLTFLHPTSCPADDWHNEKVYLGHLKKFTAMIYDEDDGLEQILFYKPTGVDF